MTLVLIVWFLPGYLLRLALAQIWVPRKSNAWEFIAATGAWSLVAYLGAHIVNRGWIAVATTYVSELLGLTGPYVLLFPALMSNSRGNCHAQDTAQSLDIPAKPSGPISSVHQPSDRPQPDHYRYAQERQGVRRQAAWRHQRRQ